MTDKMPGKCNHKWPDMIQGCSICEQDARFHSQEALDVSALRKKCDEIYEENCLRGEGAAYNAVMDYLANRLNTPIPEKAALEIFNEALKNADIAEYGSPSDLDDMSEPSQYYSLTFDREEVEEIIAALTHPAPKDALEALCEIQKQLTRHGLGSFDMDRIETIRRALQPPPPAIESVKGEIAYRGLCEIREIYCNMEGFIPETAAEGYVLQEIKRMYDTAVEHINSVNAEAAMKPACERIEGVGEAIRYTETRLHLLRENHPEALDINYFSARHLETLLACARQHASAAIPEGEK